MNGALDPDTSRRILARRECGRGSKGVIRRTSSGGSTAPAGISAPCGPVPVVTVARQVQAGRVVETHTVCGGKRDAGAFDDVHAEDVFHHPGTGQRRWSQEHWIRAYRGSASASILRKVGLIGQYCILPIDRK